MITTATKICAKVTSNPAKTDLSIPDLDFMVAGVGTAEEIRKPSRLQGCGRLPATPGGDCKGAKSWALTSVFRARLDGRGWCLFASTGQPGCDREWAALIYESSTSSERGRV